MALGGGLWLTQNKVLPGSYINFVSAAKSSANLSERGVAAMPLRLSWGPDGEIFTVTADEFQKRSQEIFGYAYTADALKELRDLFLNIREGIFFKLNTNAQKAGCSYCSAKYKGARGNAISIVIALNEAATAEEPLYDVVTLLAGQPVDAQLGVAEAAELRANAYVDWTATAILEETAGTPLTGGSDGTVADAAYQTFLDKLEAYSFNTLGVPTTSETVKGLLVNWTKRLRDEVGMKFQTVLYRSAADYEGVISVENRLVGENGDANDSAALVYWLTGAEAGCPVNKSLTNAIYNGEFAVDLDYTQKQLEDGLKAGKLMFHKVDDKVRLLDDVNSYVSFSEDKNSDFAANQTMRVLDQIGNDIAVLFNTKYLGQVPNDAAGRISFWNDIVKHHQELERLRAIEAFDPGSVTVEQGESKKAVLVQDLVTPVNAMAQLYMSVIVE